MEERERGRERERRRHHRLQQENERAEEKGEGRVAMRDSGERERETGGERRGWEGRQHLLTAEPFIDKVVPG